MDDRNDTGYVFEESDFTTNDHLPMFSSYRHRILRQCSPVGRPHDDWYREHCRVVLRESYVSRTQSLSPVRHPSNSPERKPAKTKHYSSKVTEEVRPRKTDLVAQLIRLKHDSSKTAVTKLHIIMSYKKQTVQFDLISQSGHTHAPVFNMRARSNGTTAYGTGSTKKEAKNDAAMAFMNIMYRDVCDDGTKPIVSNQFLDKSREYETADIGYSDLNPIGALQELCMAHHWALPEYEFLASDNSSDARYVAKCSLKNYRTKGEGMSKQIAKRQAAHFMYSNIRDLVIEETTTRSCNKSRTQNKVFFSDNKLEGHVKTTTNNLDFSNTSKHMEMFYNKLKSSEKPFITILKGLNSVSEFATNPVDVLMELGEEEDFTLTYELLSKKSNELGIMVRLTIHPDFVYIGTGSTINDAQGAAAYSALVYLKLLLEN